MTTTRLSLIVLTGLSLVSSAPAATLLFADNFNRANNTDLNASATGKSGSLGALNWTERAIDATGGDVAVSGNNLSFTTGTQAESVDGQAVWVDHNFTGLTEISVTVDITSGSGGNLRESGIGLGQTLANLNAMTGSSGGRSFADIYVGYDGLGTSAERGLWLYEWNGTTRTSTYLASTLVSMPDTLTIKATFADMNAGTTINYDILLNGSLFASRTAQWSGTDENYVSLHSWYQTGVTWDNFSIEGTVIPEPRAALLGGLGMFFLLRRRRVGVRSPSNK